MAGLAGGAGVRGLTARQKQTRREHRSNCEPLTWVRKLCRAGMPPSNAAQCNYLSGVFDVASARDCSITQSEAPAAAPGVLTDYEVKFVDDVRRARATGA